MLARNNEVHGAENVKVEIFEDEDEDETTTSTEDMVCNTYASVFYASLTMH